MKTNINALSKVKVSINLTSTESVHVWQNKNQTNGKETKPNDGQQYFVQKKYG